MIFLSWKKLKIRSSDEKSISILFHLAKWRERKSQELDIPRAIENPQETYDVNVTGTKNLLEALKLNDKSSKTPMSLKGYEMEYVNGGRR